MSSTSPHPRPPWSTHGKRVESTIRKALYEFQMVKDLKKVGIALSGGKDSLTLLFMLHAISGRGFPLFELTAFHVSGEFSCGAGVNLPYLKNVCAELQIKLVVLESKQKLETLECYSCSRERRSLLFHAARKEDIETIAFGHHRDDSVQTLLLNLLHKGEFAGNIPKIHMQKYGITLIRPLIFLSEEAIQTFAKQQGFQRITCQCPVGQRSMRKKVEELLQEMEELFPNTRQNLFQSALIQGSNKAANP